MTNPESSTSLPISLPTSLPTSPPTSLLGFVRHLLATMGPRGVWAFLFVLLAMAAEGTGLFLIIPLLGLAGVGVGEAAPGVILTGVDRGFSLLGVEPTLPLVLLLFLGLVTGFALADRRRQVIQAELAEEYGHALRTRLHRAVLQARWSFLARVPGARILHVLNEEVDRVGLAVFLLFGMAAEGAMVLFLLALALWVSPLATAVAAGLSLFLLVFLRRRIRSSKEVGSELSRVSGGVTHLISEQLGALKLMKSFGGESRGISAFVTLSEAYSEISVETHRRIADVGFRFRVAGAVAAGLLLWVAFSILGLSPASVILLLAVFSRLTPRVSSLARGIQSLFIALPAHDRVQSLLVECEAEEEAQAGRNAEPDAPWRLERAIEVEGVGFRYGGRDESAICDLHLTIPAGVVTAVTGPSGAGKTTLADLLQGLLVPTTGEIRVDGVPLGSDGMGRWRASVGYVPQESFLFHDSIRSNLVWARPEATDAEIEEALERAQALEFVRRLPEGIETVVGDRGAQLSGGERQRIAMARALLRRPTLLILDEATSALDEGNERAILDTLFALEGEVTVLLISHRSSALEGVERVYRMEGGRVV